MHIYILYMLYILYIYIYILYIYIIYIYIDKLVEILKESIHPYPSTIEMKPVDVQSRNKCI